MALRTEWRQVRMFREASAMHRQAAEALLAACGAVEKSELAYVAVYLSGYSVECILKARFLSAIRPKRHKRALEVLKKTAGHDLLELVEMLGKLRKPILPPPEVMRCIRDVGFAWDVNMRYAAKAIKFKSALETTTKSKEVGKWCES